MGWCSLLLLAGLLAGCQGDPALTGRWLLEEASKQGGAPANLLEFEEAPPAWATGTAGRTGASGELGPFTPELRGSYRANAGAEPKTLDMLITEDCTSGVCTKLPPGSMETRLTVYRFRENGERLEIGFNTVEAQRPVNFSDAETVQVYSRLE